jgi:hypothetical protein
MINQVARTDGKSVAKIGDADELTEEELTLVRGGTIDAFAPRLLSDEGPEETRRS